MVNGAGITSRMEDGEGRDSEEMMEVRGEAMVFEGGVVVLGGRPGTGTGTTITTERVGLAGVVSAKKIGWQRRRGRLNSPLLRLCDAILSFFEYLNFIFAITRLRLYFDVGPGTRHCTQGNLL